MNESVLVSNPSTCNPKLAWNITLEEPIDVYSNIMCSDSPEEYYVASGISSKKEYDTLIFFNANITSFPFGIYKVWPLAVSVFISTSESRMLDIYGVTLIVNSAGIFTEYDDALGIWEDKTTDQFSKYNIVSSFSLVVVFSTSLVFLFNRKFKQKKTRK
ncbi:MAG: hypothetical protein ACTSYA_12050 [Candidatus Kariarchaeaceae archaeon]